MTAFSLQADLDIRTAPACFDDLVLWVDGHEAGQRAEIELTDAAPTQVALQLLVAAHRALIARDAVAAPGPLAQQWLHKERKGTPDGEDHSDD